MSKKLFAVYLGGRAPKCNTELHDVVFVVGETIETTYEPLMDQWFGTPEGLHLDAWVELDIVDGYKIKVAETKAEHAVKLYFVNLGAYRDGEFTEIHANKFIVAETAPEAKAKAKREWLKRGPLSVHTDDLYEVDDCLDVGQCGAYHIILEKTDEKEALRPVNGYHLIPKKIVQQYIADKAESANRRDISQ